MPAAQCQNGWPVLAREQTVIYQIGEVVKVRLAPGAPGELLAHFARWFDDNIRDLDPGILDDWGWADRPIIGSTDTSNHAGGYAVDLNATKWGLGSKASIYLSDSEIAAVHRQLALYDGVIRWGGDYTGRTDPMHFEIVGTAAQVAQVWAKLTAPAPAATSRPTIKIGATGQPVVDLQTRLARSYPLYRHALGVLYVDGDFGRITDRWVREFQRRSGLVVDGIVGPKTWAGLGL